VHLDIVKLIVVEVGGSWEGYEHSKRVVLIEKADIIVVVLTKLKRQRRSIVWSRYSWLTTILKALSSVFVARRLLAARLLFLRVLSAVLFLRRLLMKQPKHEHPQNKNTHTYVDNV
jgi:hypothetical protein